jgi:hypothetical protein
MSILWTSTDVLGSPWILPAEGLLGAARLAPDGAALRAFNVAARRCRTHIFYVGGSTNVLINC